MSFSTDVKEELSKLSNLANKNCVKAEMYGYLNSNNVSATLASTLASTSTGKSCIKFSTESEYNINRFAKLLNNLSIQKYNIDIVGKNFTITIQKEQSIFIKYMFEEYKIEANENEEKAFVRGTFLGGGTINNPKNKYHIEIALKGENVAKEVINILEKYGINFKMLNTEKVQKAEKTEKVEKTEKEIELAKSKKASKCIIYSKDGEEISKFLAFVGASNSVLKFEDIRVYRNMRNNVNRIVNCETANLSKTVGAAVKQIEAINKLKKEGKFNKLPDNLKEIAELRIKNPEASLTELGKMLTEPVGKSGVNYRLQTIVKMSS